MSMPSYDESSNRLTLPAGYRLDDYRIERLLGKGSFGLTYLALDEKLNATVAIKELLPDGIATRLKGHTVGAQTAALVENYQWALQRFVEEAQTLARLNHPNIVRVLRLIEANGTAYMVMEFVEGESFTSWIKRHPHPVEQDLLDILMPLLDGLEYLHGKGLLHRDIKPDNIFITPEGRPVLLDFGSARVDLGRTVAATAIVSDGYSPREQYQQKSRQGPYSDLYALGAVAVHAMTGEKPAGAIDRWADSSLERPLTERLGRQYSTGFLRAIETAFAVAPEDRPQSVSQMRNILQVQPTLKRVAEQSPTPPSRVPSKPAMGPEARTNAGGQLLRQVPPLRAAGQPQTPPRQVRRKLEVRPHATTNVAGHFAAHPLLRPVSLLSFCTWMLGLALAHTLSICADETPLAVTFFYNRVRPAALVCILASLIAARKPSRWAAWVAGFVSFLACLQILLSPNFSKPASSPEPVIASHFVWLIMLPATSIAWLWLASRWRAKQQAGFDVPGRLSGPAVDALGSASIAFNGVLFAEWAAHSLTSDRHLSVDGTFAMLLFFGWGFDASLRILRNRTPWAALVQCIWFVAGLCLVLNPVNPISQVTDRVSVPWAVVEWLQDEGARWQWIERGTTMLVFLTGSVVWMGVCLGLCKDRRRGLRAPT